jgi:hypothetical protein
MLARSSVCFAPMGIKRPQLGLAQWCFWRRLTGIVVICTLILQSLFFGFVAAPTTALASLDDGFPAFELCQHGPQGAPVSPADLPGHHGTTHCVFCFAGTHHYLAPGPLPLSLSRQVDLKAENAWWPVDNRHASILSKYSIARPRGPPPSA